MEIADILETYSLNDFPVALGGCRNEGISYDNCEYDLSVFDERTEPDTVLECGDGLAVIHHCSLNETRSCVLVQFDNMKVIRDEQWALRTLLYRIRERRAQIYRDQMKNSLVDALFCITRSRDGAKESDPFAPCWLKCAAFYVADAILLRHLIRPSPAHSMHLIRALRSDEDGEGLSAINACTGMERSTPVLLERMSESVAGFSDMIEGNDRSRIIRAKHDYFVENSFFSDCYFYLGYMTRNLMASMGNELTRRPELAHLLRLALDADSDPSAVDRQAGLLYASTHRMLALA